MNNRFTNNVVMSKWASGFHYNDGTPPDWHSVFKDWLFASNVFTRINGFSTFFYMKDFGSANFEVDSPEDVDFVNWQSENLELTAASWGRSAAIDGGPLGADVAGLMSHRNDVISGVVTLRSPVTRASPARIIQSIPPPPIKLILVPPAIRSASRPSVSQLSRSRSR